MRLEYKNMEEVQISREVGVIIFPRAPDLGMCLNTLDVSRHMELYGILLQEAVTIAVLPASLPILLLLFDRHEFRCP